MITKNQRRPYHPPDRAAIDREVRRDIIQAAELATLDYYWKLRGGSMSLEEYRLRVHVAQEEIQLGAVSRGAGNASDFPVQAIKDINPVL